MHPTKNDWEKLPNYLSEFSQITTDFIQSIEQRPVASKHRKISHLDLTETGHSFEQVTKHLRENLIPNLSASRGPRYWGFVTGGATPIATFADWLVSTFDQNPSKFGDSISCNIELQTINWLRELFYLPSSFQGSLTTGATAANFLATLTARQYLGKQQGIDVAKDGVYGLDIGVFSTTPHASMIKGLGMAGLGQKQVTYIDSLGNTEAMNCESLEQALINSENKSKLVIASAATVTATDFDDLISIRKICDKYNAWLHVDAAFGIFERLVNGVNSKTKGLELADSITLDNHKWLNVPYESGVFLTRHRQQLFDSCDVPAPYFVNSSTEPGFMSLGVENSRRFRALPIWLTILAYGREGIKSWVERNIESAKNLADWLATSNNYELVHPCQLNVVLFKPKTDQLSLEQGNKLTSKFLNAINADGRLLLSPGTWLGQSIIRAAISNWQTDNDDIEIAKLALTQVANKINNN